MTSRPTSSGNGKTTLEKGGRDPPDVSLDYIFNNSLSYLNEFKRLREAKQDAENKYNIKKEDDDCWPADDIKRAWGKTQRMEKEPSRRKHWALVIIFQMIERQRKERSGLNEGGNRVQGCAEQWNNMFVKTEGFLKGNSEDKSSQSNGELETVGAVADVHDKENGRRGDGLWSAVNMNQACGKTEGFLKGNSEDKSSQSNAELETVGAAGRVNQHSGANHTTYRHHGQTYGVSQSRTGTQFPVGNQATGNYPGVPGGQYRNGVALESENMRRAETLYIRIPLEVMVNNEPTHIENQDLQVTSPYKLINGFPETNGNIEKRKSYVMSFNHDTNNAKWVYEILNRETLVNNCEQQVGFGHGYDRGHLAAARNHKWCREALNDANLNSNIAPQHLSLNRGPWHTFESWCRELCYVNWTRNVHVYSGPIYQRRMNPPALQGKIVPSHFFKVIIVENVDGTVEEPECYLMPNAVPTHFTLTEYQTTINEIERFSRLTFIERRTNVREMDRIITVRLQGVDLNAITQSVDIGVRISS